MRIPREKLVRAMALYLTEPVTLSEAAERHGFSGSVLGQFIREYLELRPDERFDKAPAATSGASRFTRYAASGNWMVVRRRRGSF